MKLISWEFDLISLLIQRYSQNLNIDYGKIKYNILMKKINLIILSTFIIWVMLINLEIRGILSHAQENIDRNIIPLLIPPYQLIKNLGSSDLNKFNVTYVNNIP